MCPGSIEEMLQRDTFNIGLIRNSRHIAETNQIPQAYVLLLLFLF